MESHTRLETHTCVVCSKVAESVCRGCKATPDDTGGLTAVYYCDSTCQRSDWKSHKPVCRTSKDRQALFRAGQIVQRLCYTFRRATWSWPIAKVRNKRKEEGFGVLWEIVDGEHPNTGYFLPFTTDMFPDIKDQEAILTHGGCEHAIAGMDYLVMDLLKGMSSVCADAEAGSKGADKTTDTYSDIREVTVRLKNAPMRIIRYRGSNPIIQSLALRHEVFRVTLTNGEAYALDITAAQYGWYGSAVMPWDRYLKERVAEVKDVRELGQTAQTLRAEAQASARDVQLEHQITEKMTGCFDALLKAWQRDNTTFKAMLRCPEVEFGEKRNSLLEFMEERMSWLKDDFNDGMNEGARAAKAAKST
ncbi:MAG: hypothetical protein L6R39_002000 [Caloplaca ligustica]|nr:MAG: hypothetical protein L6R39_002000 [Caloplaca ligustica]